MQRSRLCAMMHRIAIRRAPLCLTIVLCLAGLAHADGGTVQSSQLVGGYRVTIFTSPNPLRQGPVDLSVWVQEAASGQSLPEASVGIELLSADGISLRAAATREAATNKLLRAAILDVPKPGLWQVRANVSGHLGEVRLACPISVGPPMPKWRSMWMWYSWPAAFVALFVWRQMHSSMAGRRRPH